MSYCIIFTLFFMKIDISVVFWPVWCTLWDICSQLSQTEFTENLSKKCKFFLEFKFDSIVFSNWLLVTFCDSTILNESYIICNLVITVLSLAILVPPHSIFQQNIHRWTKKWLKRKGIYVSIEQKYFQFSDTYIILCTKAKNLVKSWIIKTLTM